MTDTWNFKKWTAQQTNTLKEMWAEGRSPQTIAVTLGFRDSASIMAKADSLGLFEAVKRVPSLTELPRKRGEPLPLTKPDGTLYTLADARDNQCRWMPGPPTMDSPICGHPIKAKSWCAYHHDKRVFVRGAW